MPAPAQNVDLGSIGLDRGGHLLVKRALARCAAGEWLEVRGTSPELATHLRAWCRAQGHRLEEGERLVVVRGDADRGRWSFTSHVTLPSINTT